MFQGTLEVNLRPCGKHLLEAEKFLVRCQTFLQSIANLRPEDIFAMPELHHFLQFIQHFFILHEKGTTYGDINETSQGLHPETEIIISNTSPPKAGNDLFPLLTLVKGVWDANYKSELMVLCVSVGLHIKNVPVVQPPTKNLV